MIDRYNINYYVRFVRLFVLSLSVFVSGVFVQVIRWMMKYQLKLVNVWIFSNLFSLKLSRKKILKFSILPMSEAS